VSKRQSLLGREKYSVGDPHVGVAVRAFWKWGSAPLAKNGRDSMVDGPPPKISACNMDISLPKSTPA